MSSGEMGLGFVARLGFHQKGQVEGTDCFDFAFRSVAGTQLCCSPFTSFAQSPRELPVGHRAVTLFSAPTPRARRGAGPPAHRAPVQPRRQMQRGGGWSPPSPRERFPCQLCRLPSLLSHSVTTRCHPFLSHSREEIQTLTKKFQELEEIKRGDNGDPVKATPEVQFMRPGAPSRGHG